MPPCGMRRRCPQHHDSGALREVLEVYFHAPLVSSSSGLPSSRQIAVPSLRACIRLSIHIEKLSMQCSAAHQHAGSGKEVHVCALLLRGRRRRQRRRCWQEGGSGKLHVRGAQQLHQPRHRSRRNPRPMRRDVPGSRRSRGLC